MSRPVPADIVAAAQKAQRATRVPASVSIAQWALESAWGAKAPGNNPFGIKARPGQPHVTFATHEVVHGKTIAVMAAFRAFPTIADAFEAHAELLAEAEVYAPAMAVLPDVAHFVAAMGPHYATDPAYAGKILSIIRGGDLTRFDAANDNGAPTPARRSA